MKRLTTILGLLILVAALWMGPAFSADGRAWKKVTSGLYLGNFPWDQGDGNSQEPILILKIDPAVYSLRLLCASEQGGQARSVEEWCKGFGLAAAVNASMYLNNDPLKSTGYMKNYGHFNNKRINQVFGAFMAFNPVFPSDPDVRIIDRYENRDWRQVIERYHSVIQNYRMISNGTKVEGWEKQEKASRMAAVGMDKDNCVLFVFTRARVSTQDFIQVLLSLGVQIQSAMYVEGGPEAALHLVPDQKMGSGADHGDKGLWKDAENEPGLPIPNVIGIVKKK